MSQNNNHAARKNLGSFSKAVQQPSKPIGSWPHLAQANTAQIKKAGIGQFISFTNKVDTQPGASKEEKVNFLSGFAIGMFAGATLPEFQGVSKLQGLKGQSLDKLPDFKSMTDKELDSWVEKYSALIEKL